MYYKNDIMESTDLRALIKEKALKHRTYYESLVESDTVTKLDSVTPRQMEVVVSNTIDNRDENKYFPGIPNTLETGSQGSLGTKSRQRKRGVYEIKPSVDEAIVEFKSVKQLRENYQAMLEKTYKHLNQGICKDDVEKEKSEFLLPPSSGYCSSSASGASDDERDKSWFQKNVVRRSASSDSAVHSDDDTPIVSNWGEKKEECASADAYCSKSPYTPRGSIDHSNVRSRTIIESKYVPLPLDRKFSVDLISDSPSDNISESRRQSCFSEGDEQPRYRYWRTPSVVVSDYSDDIMGLTLEDIEYIRNRKEHYSSPDSSLHSSCSNLNYCGSSISGIESDYVLCKPYRKSSNCSTCSTLSDEEETPAETTSESTLQPQRNREVDKKTLCDRGKCM